MNRVVGLVTTACLLVLIGLAPCAAMADVVEMSGGHSSTEGHDRDCCDDHARLPESASACEQGCAISEHAISILWSSEVLPSVEPPVVAPAVDAERPAVVAVAIDPGLGESSTEPPLFVLNAAFLI